MEPISATLIVYNEEHNINNALQSLSWADEIVVVDSGSTDATLEICRQFTDKILHRNWTGYVDQKNHAVENAKNDWIFSLDADERVSPELRSEIGELAARGFLKRGYKIPRIAFFMGRWIKHGDWYPDYQLRLFDRKHGKWEGGSVHESVRIDASPGFLKGDIYHFTYRDLSDYLRRLEIYSNLAAFDYQQKGRRAGLFSLLFNPAAAFAKAFLLKRGFLDGTPGFTVAVMGAVSVFFKYAKLYELRDRGI
ncbi:MAG: glycosyltransferase family 2 protein [Acidobacteria bacterium]|nr:glycosyltransferase family 2 protein [Acidobacteriota bacterium]